MIQFLIPFSVVLGLVILFAFINEKKTHLTYEIALLLFGTITGIVTMIIASIVTNERISDILNQIQVFNIEHYLMNGVLCFMLFAGSCHLKLSDFKKEARNITVMAIICTLLGTVFYGILFYAAAYLLGLPFNIPICLMFGSIVSPTDPIAATSILRKFGLNHKISFLMESESLLNDGVGVALFVVFSGIALFGNNQGIGGFLSIIAREIIGAAAVGSIVTWLCFQIFKRTDDKKQKIFISLLFVALSYVLCEIFEFSGAISCVVCGLIFSSLREQETKKENNDLTEFDTFWDILDTWFNSSLYIILGLTAIRIIQMPNVMILAILAVVINLLARFTSVLVGTFLMGQLPDGYTKGRFSALFTWGGLRGGLSIALAMSTSEMVNPEIYHIILGCTYSIVFFTTVIQGLTMNKIYNKLKS